MHEQLLEALSRETDVPLDRIREIYRIEQAYLLETARIKTFVPLLAARRVRSVLRDG